MTAADCGLIIITALESLGQRLLWSALLHALSDGNERNSFVLSVMLANGI